MGSPSEYRQNAADCLRAAQDTTNENSKALLLSMAEKWVMLADEIEARLRANAKASPSGDTESE